MKNHIDVDVDFFFIDNNISTYMAPFSSPSRETDMFHGLESSFLMGVSQKMNADWIRCAQRSRAFWWERNIRRENDMRHRKILLIEYRDLPTVNDNFFALQTLVIRTDELNRYDLNS